MRRVAIVALAASMVVAACSGSGGAAPATTVRRAPLPTPPGGSTRYFDYRYSFVYPAGWVEDRQYLNLFRDARGRAYGYFQADALEGDRSTLDQITAAEANHPSQYGANPQITSVAVDGREARLIVPDATTAPNLYTAGLVVPYPGDPRSPPFYNYIRIWAHRDYIQAIANSFVFRSSTP